MIFDILMGAKYGQLFFEPLAKWQETLDGRLVRWAFDHYLSNDKYRWR
jgi:hypothetical protein